MSNWIPITKQLPEKDESVLVYIDDGNEPFQMVAWRYNDNPRAGWTCDSGAVYYDVTHWQSLPEAPRGDE